MVAAHGYPAYRCFKAMQRRRVDLHELLFFCQFWSVLPPPRAFPSCCPRRAFPSYCAAPPPRAAPTPSPRAAPHASLVPSTPVVHPHASSPACTSPCWEMLVPVCTRARHHHPVLPRPLSQVYPATIFHSIPMPLFTAPPHHPSPSPLPTAPPPPPLPHRRVLLSLLALLEGLASPLLDWVPLYLEAKLAFIVYLWHPRTQGTEIVYGSMLQPLLSRHEPIIDRHLAHLEDRGRDMAVDCWRAGVAYTGARFEELIAYLASLSAQAAASAAMRGLEGSERREERERRERQVEVLRSEKGDGAERRKVGDEQQEEVRGRRKYLQKYGGEAVQLRSVAGDGGVQRPGYERRLLGDEAEGDGRRAEVEEQRVQQGSVQRQAVRYRNVDSDSKGDGGESDGASGGSGASSEFEMVDAEREFSTGSAADERAAAGTAASAGGAGSGGTGRGGGSGWWGSKQLTAGLAGLGRALSPSNSQARQAAAAPPAMLHGALPPAALLPAGVASGLDDVAPDQVDDVAAATMVGEASPHPSGINLRPRRSQRPKKQF
ncbi:unnamed protein product [Closterium sp. NIES-65]|nr:unnamed protein product [Closterium sp. NIES-65]